MKYTEAAFPPKQTKRKTLGRLEGQTAPLPRKKRFCSKRPLDPQRGGGGTQGLSLHGAPGKQAEPDRGAGGGSRAGRAPRCSAAASTARRQPGSPAARGPASCLRTSTPRGGTHLTPQGRVPVSHVGQQGGQAEAEALGHREGTWRQRQELDPHPAQLLPLTHCQGGRSQQGRGPACFLRNTPAFLATKCFSSRNFDAS